MKWKGEKNPINQNIGNKIGEMHMAMKSNLAITAMVLMLTIPLAHAGVQKDGYTVTPTTLKPGMAGTLNLILNNPSSTEFITGAYLDAKASNIFFVPSTKIGDLGALGTTNVALPFRISEEAAPGTAPVTLELTYTSSIQGGSNYKSFSIPITVSATNLIKISNIQSSKETIYPGDTFIIEASIENAGGSIKNGVLSYLASADYTFDGTTKIDIGNIGPSEKKRISIPILAGNGIDGGAYSIPFTLTYDDGVTAGLSETIYFGPISAISEYEKFSIFAQTQDATPGGSGTISIIIKNTGSSDLKSFKVTLPQDSKFFTPLDFTEKTIDSIKVGETKTMDFTVGIGTNIAAQVYSLPLSITYQTKSGADSVTKTVGVKIGGAPALSAYISSNPAVMTNDNRPYSISIQVSNTGNTAVRALTVKVASKELEILSPADSFVGTLNLDDYSTVQYDALVKKGVEPGKYNIDVSLSYKDSYNEPHVEDKLVQFEIFPGDIAAIAGKQNGSNPMVTIIIVLAVIVVGYFGYRRFFKSNMSQKLKLK